MSQRTRVLVVDDSATMRAMISAALRADPELEVVGEAADPLAAREAIKRLSPDVITLDIEMPNMNGLEFLERLMRLRPLPVVMVSTLTQKGADATLAALELGAVDCVAKPTGANRFPELAATVKAAAAARPRARGPVTAPSARPDREYRPGGSLIAIGSSTGGVEALLTILAEFPVNCPPTIITQHMPANFTASFADRLDRHCAASVQEAFDGAELSVGQVYLAPGGEQHLTLERSGGLRCRLKTGDPISGHRPSVDALFQSVAETAGAASVGVILTGMGRDGAAGLARIQEVGGFTLGQDEATCVVYGMPRAAFEMGAVRAQRPLGEIASTALTAASATRRAA